MQRYPAMQQIVGDPEQIREFNPAQQKELKKMLEAAEIGVRVGITRAYRYLFYPSADAPRKDGKVCHETLGNLSSGEPEEIEAIRLALKHKRNLAQLLKAQPSLLARQGLSVGAV